MISCRATYTILQRLDGVLMFLSYSLQVNHHFNMYHSTSSAFSDRDASVWSSTRFPCVPGNDVGGESNVFSSISMQVLQQQTVDSYLFSSNSRSAFCGTKLCEEEGAMSFFPWAGDKSLGTTRPEVTYRDQVCGSHRSRNVFVIVRHPPRCRRPVVPVCRKNEPLSTICDSNGAVED